MAKVYLKKVKWNPGKCEDKFGNKCYYYLRTCNGISGMGCAESVFIQVSNYELAWKELRKRFPNGYIIGFIKEIEKEKGIK